MTARPVRRPVRARSAILCADMRLLVVDDEVQLARTIAQALQEEGFNADVALDGERGLRLALEHRYDLVILDLLLPSRPGLEVLAELKRVRPTLPVLVLTALDAVDAVVDGLDQGADDYLTKPFALRELIARVRSLLRRGVFAGTVLQVGDVSIDLRRHAVTRRDVPVALTAREYALLVLLAHRRGEVLSRDAIGESLIARDFESTSNMIDVSIYGLRRKLGEPDLIRTVRGLGYGLLAEAGR